MIPPLFETRMRAPFILISLALIALGYGTVLAADKPPIPESGTYLGAILLTGQTRPYEFNIRTGTQHAIFEEFIKFPEILGAESEERQSFDAFIRACRSAGAMPLITLETFGGLNSYSSANIESFCTLLYDTNMPLFLRWNHEMNGSWYPWGQLPTLYVEKYREFATFVHHLAPNVAMAWTPNQAWGYPWAQGTYSIASTSTEMSILDTNHDGQLSEEDDPYLPYYPGDDYVDWVGISFYHWGNGLDRGFNQIPPEGKWGLANGINNVIPNFHELFAVGHNKPMMIAETSALYDSKDTRHGGAAENDIKMAWLRQVYNLADTDNPTLDRDLSRIKAICWFSQLKYEAEVGGDVDWRLDSNADLTTYYASLVTDPYFLKAQYPAESLSIQSAPTQIKAGQTYTVSISHTTVEPRILLVNILDPSNNYAWHGGGTLRIDGSGTSQVSIELINAPIPGDGYSISAALVPDGGDQTEYFYVVQTPVSISPSSTISLTMNATQYLPGSAMSVRASLTMMQEPADIYIALIIPDGSIYCLREDGLLQAEVVPMLYNVMLGAVDSAEVFATDVLPQLPVGHYQWCLVLAAPGSNVLRAENWVASSFAEWEVPVY